MRVGLTGGIACGKSRVGKRLAAAGMRLLDLDQVSRAVMTRGGPAFAEVVAAFGPGILAGDGSIDRKALGAIVFSDPEARARLNAITHPKILAEEARWAAGAKPDEILVTEAALLVESGALLRFDRLVVVFCEEGEQIRRLRDREGIGETEARARLTSQMPLAEKRRFGHFVVDASGRVADTDAAGDRLAADLRRLVPRAEASPVPEARAAACLRHGPASGPRGLHPVALAQEIAEAGELQMARVAQRLAPPANGPWYAAGQPGNLRPGAEALMAPVVLWSMERGPVDPDFVVAAATALGRLVHADRPPIADACLYALALLEVAAAGTVPPDLSARVRAHRRRAEYWGGAPGSARVGAITAAAVLHPREPDRARAAAGDDGALAGALVGLGSGV
jgi:dephospho-CoA kinase